MVDDNSTEDVLGLIKEYRGRLNIKYIKYDHTLHPIWQELNPDKDNPESWYHTQAISANIGINKAQGEIIAISQPEILHSPNSFRHGYDLAKEGKQVYAEIHWGTQLFNDWLTNNDWQAYNYDSLFEIAQNFGEEYHPNHMPDNTFYEMYWYTLFLPKQAALAVNGVDLRYQAGVYAEDDQFRARVRMAGYPDVWGGRPQLTGDTYEHCIGIHQSHSDEGNKTKRQNRESQHWNLGAERNRHLWAQFQANPYTIANEGLPYSPWGEFLITEEQDLPLSG